MHQMPNVIDQQVTIMSVLWLNNITHDRVSRHALNEIFPCNLEFG